jgi:hypothetical protein
MKPQCLAAVQRAIGRELNQAESAKIEELISKNANQLARRDPDAWRQLSDGQRLEQAAEAAVKELLAEAALKKYRLQRQIETHDAINRQTAAWEGGRLDGLKRMIASVTDGRGSFRSVETLAHSIRTDALRQLSDVFESLDPRLFGFLENKEGVDAFTRAVFGERKDIDPTVVKAAEAWLKVAEDMRQQFNNAGGKVGKLESWSLPQHHAQLRVAKAGVDRWTADILPLLDRKQYVRDDGRLMTDDQVRAFLGEAWRSIATNGRNKLKPGQRQGTGMMANRNAEARSIHFKDAESYMAYQANYGEKALLQVMVDHIGGMARDTASVEVFGPNPNAAFEYFRDTALKEAAGTDPQHIGRYEEQVAKLTNLWNVVMGESQPVANEALARGFEATRNWLVASRLGSAVVSSIADIGTVVNTARVNQLPVMQVFRNELSAMNLTNKEELRQARRAGLALDTAIGDLNRWGMDNLVATVPAKLAHATMRASGLNAVTDVRRRAFGVTMMDSIGHLTREVDSLARLDADDNRILLSKGITEADWTVWRAATPEKWGGNDTVLTPDSVYNVPDSAIEHMIPDLATRGAPGTPAYTAALDKIRRDAALKLIGAVAEEVDMAVITPKALERGFTGAGLQRGTWRGELTRSVFLFKTTPLASVFRHWQRGMAENTTGSKAMYIGMHVAMSTSLGLAVMQIKEILAGRDPRALYGTEHASRNWLQGFLQGGSFGLYGDFLFSGTTGYSGQSPAAAFLGPVVGAAEELFKLTQGNIVEAAQGKDTHIGAEAIRFVRGNTPGASLWYLKAGLDHLIVHNLQEMMSPGYLNTMRRRQEREFGQTYYWEPGTTTPQRAPDLGRVVGQ